MLFTSQQYEYPILENTSKIFPQLNSNTEKNIETFLKRKSSIIPQSPNRFDNEDEDKSTSINNFSFIISSFKEIEERNNINEDIFSNDSDVININKKLYSEKSVEKNSTNVNIKKKTKKIIKCIKRKIFKCIKIKKIFKCIKIKKGKRYNEKEKKDDNYKKIRKDNIKVMIVRYFFNKYLRSILNEKLKNVECLFSFDFFPKIFTKTSANKKNRKIWKKKLIQIFEEKELYNEEDLKNYFFNKDVIRRLKLEENKSFFEASKLDEILNEKISDIYIKCLDSKEYKEEIKTLEINENKYFADEWKKCAEDLQYDILK